MNKKQNGQTVFETGKLPEIIANKETFGEMTVAERREFYKMANSTFEKNGEKALSTEYIKALLLYPESRLNGILTSNCKKTDDKAKEKKWQIYVSVFSVCLKLHAKVYLPKYENEDEVYSARAKRAKSRVSQLKAAIDYAPKTECYA